MILGAHVVALQETRCPEGNTRVGPFIRLSAGAMKGQLGTELWLHSTLPFMFANDTAKTSICFQVQEVTVVHADPRRLIARVQSGHWRLLIASLHAPHRGHEHHFIREWWEATRVILHKFGQTSKLLLAGDLNASVGSLVSPHVGPIGREEEDLPGQLWHQLLRDFECFIPSTFGHYQDGDTATYCQKRNKHLCRPDMVAIPIEWQTGYLKAWVAHEIHVALAVQDHWATCVHVTMPVGCPASRLQKTHKRIDVATIMDPANADAVRSIIASTPSVAWDVSSHAHAAIVIDHLQAGLSRMSIHQPARPRHPYITEETWTLQRTVTSWRRSRQRLCLQRRNQLRAVCFYAWSGRRQSEYQGISPLHTSWMLRAILFEVAHCYQVSVLSKKLRNACRKDRDAYVGELAQRVAHSPNADVFSALHRLLGHKRKKPYMAEPLPHLLDTKGEPCRDADAVRQRWRQHFGAMEGGVETDFASLPDALLLREARQTPWPAPADVKDLPSFADFQKVLIHTKLHKAPGPDGIPGALLKCFAPDCAAILYPLLLKLIFRGSEAIGLKGGLAVKFWKGKGSKSDAASYRQILLASNVAKCMHQALRPTISRLFVGSTPPLQIGGKPGGNVVFGAHLTRSFLRWQYQQKRTCFILFTDIASAFYSVVRQLVAKDDQGNLQPPSIEGIQLSEADLELLCEACTTANGFGGCGSYSMARIHLSSHH